MIIGTTLMFIGIAHESLWFDESYTAALMNHSLKDIIEITSTDSHPPLYYLLLRIFSAVFGRSVFALRAFSVVGTAALASLGIGPVRRIFGNRYALVYSFLIFALPISFSMSQEARMYTWSAFFVAGSALMGYLAYLENKKTDWIAFGLFSIAAAYTHYYALLAAVIICGLLLVYMLAGKKKIAPYLITGGALIAAYLPWLFKLSRQVVRVAGDFWIPPVTGEVITKTLVYPFLNKFSYYESIRLTNYAFYLAVAFIVFGIIYRIVKKDSKGKMAIFAISGYALTLLAGIIASFVIRPVLVERYIMPVFGLFVLGLAYGIGSLGKRILPIAACVVLVLMSVSQIKYNMVNRFNGPMTEAEEYLETRVQPDDVFVHTDEHTLGTFCYYFPDNVHYYYQKDGRGGYSNYDAFLPQCVIIESLDEIDCDSTLWIIQRNGGADTRSMGGWLSTKQIVYSGAPKSFKVDPSWYAFMVHPMSLTD